MVSVVQRIRKIKQPHGGYIPSKRFRATQLHDEAELNSIENIHPSLIGLTVDYLTRVNTGTKPEDAFSASILGAINAKDIPKASELLDGIYGVDNLSIINACKLSGYDVCFRQGMEFFKPVDEINPDADTIENIRIMVRRGMAFFENYGPVILNGFRFNGAYTDTVTDGDGDFLTETTLWDFKVSVKRPDKNHTLQILMYYLMGLRSEHEDKFKKLNSLGFFNPRLNQIYLLEIENIDKNLMDLVSKEIIGYLD